MSQRYQIFALAMICGCLAAFSAYWMNGELVRHGIFVTPPKHIACLNEEVARKVRDQLTSSAFRESLAVAHFSPDDLQVDAVADGKWIEARLTLKCWGRASYSLARFQREFDASDPKARSRNQAQLDAFDAKMKEIANAALIGGV